MDATRKTIEELCWVIGRYAESNNDAFKPEEFARMIAAIDAAKVELARLRKANSQ